MVPSLPLVDAPLLVRGIHDTIHKTKDKWCQIVTDIILGRWPSRSPQEWTHMAECGLGIVGLPYYFYVMRTERAYGTAIFLFRDSSNPPWPKGMTGATPFDSEDLWHGRLHTHSPNIPNRDKRSTFQRYETPLEHWCDAFRKYIATNYEFPSHYVQGHPPKVGSLPIVPTNPPNTPAAWTWEVRIPNDHIASKLKLVRGFMSDQDRNAYSNWLSRERDVGRDQLRFILLQIERYITFARSVFRAAKNEILGIEETQR